MWEQLLNLIMAGLNTGQQAGGQLLGNLANYSQYRDQLTQLQRVPGEIVPALERIGGNVQGALGEMFQGDINRFQPFAAGLQRQFGDIQQINQTGFQGLEQQLADLGRNVTGGYDERLRRNLASLEGMGTQARIDIDEAARNQAGVLSADLTSRGLAGTSVLPSAQMGVERERLAERRRLEESIRQQRLNVDIGLSGEALGARERFGLAGLGLGQEALQQRLGLGLQGLNLQSQLGYDLLGRQLQQQLMPLQAYEQYSQQGLGILQQDILNQVNAMNNLAVLPPDAGAFQASMTNLGAGSVRGPSAPQDRSVLGAGIIGGSTVAATLAPKLFGSPFCIDGEAVIVTETDNVPLRLVIPGMQVLGSDGAFHKVIAKDYGQQYPSRRDDYIRITVASRHSLVLTKDHKISGRAAGRYRVGDSIQMPFGKTSVLAVQKTQMVPSGDLALDGCDGYEANGFMVNTVPGLIEATRKNIECRS